MNDLSLLYGSGQKKNIVSVETIRGRENTVEVFTRTGDSVSSEYIVYNPFLYVNDEDPIIEKLYSSTNITPLLGGNFFNRIIHGDYDNLKWMKNEAEKSYMPFLQSQWMIQSGETLFKGMNFNDPLRLYVDIETLTTEGFDFPNSNRPGDKICMIAMKTNTDEEYVLTLNEDGKTPKTDGVVRCKDEKTLLEKFVLAVRKINPDILLGHHFFGFDLPYIRDRAQLLGVPLKLGRDGSEPNTFETKIKFAEKEDEYENFQIYGRHIIDTMFLAKQYDVVARTLDSYGLKSCVKQLGLNSEERTYIDGSKITEYWHNDRQTLLDYALDDVRETQVLDSEWGQAIFVQAKMFPLPFQDTFRYGSGNKVDTVFIRHYYNNNWSLPTADEKRKYGGGYANTFIYGYIGEPTIYCDVGSLYPTLGEILKIQPYKDELGLYQKILTLLKTERYKYKKGAKKHEKTNPQLAKKYKATDGAVKILLNSMSYGWLGWQWGMFNDYDEAERITTWGQRVVKTMNKEAKKLGGEVLRTDSVTEDTPIYVKNDDGLIDIISIGTLHNIIGKKNKKDALRNYKGFENYKILTRSGWSKIKYTKKHKADKSIYRILTRNGLAKVTGDHSLFQNGKEVKPNKLTVGEKIDELPFENFKTQNTKITKDQAWLLGFMISDGSASKIKRKSYGYSITTAVHKADKNKLLKAQKILNEWGFDFRLYNTMKSSGCNRLASSKADVYNFFYPLLYDSYTKEKKVPKEILNANKNIIYSFLQGQMDGDGHVVNRPNTVNITTKSYILATGLQFLCRKIGWYDTSIVSIRPDKPNIISINFSDPTKPLKNKEHIIRKIDLVEYNKEVYDVSTEDGTFVGGTGNVIFHNTDGSLVVVPEQYRGEENELKYVKLIEENLNTKLKEML